MKISVAICTRNRAESLGKTLESFAHYDFPREVETELLLIDNGSTDTTQEIVNALSPRLDNFKYVFEGKQGLSAARNSAVVHSVGDIIVFTDDDVVPGAEWLEHLCKPLLCGKADAVTGGIELAPHLTRPWMTAQHECYLASTKYHDLPNLHCLIGANMAFTRDVLLKVPLFDPELGPGALGFCDDVLFSRQLLKAGYYITGEPKASVVHHFDPVRLSRRSFLRRMSSEGYSEAYIAHHWEHSETKLTVSSLVRAYILLQKRRFTQRHRWLYAEGMPEWEMDAIRNVSFAIGRLKLKNKKRNYQKYGLVKHV
jgi:glucosyl-dolichyl phosphate glucuronosyltransferase